MSTTTDTPDRDDPAATTAGRRRWPLVVAAVLSGLLVLLIAALAWMVSTPAGSRLALRQATALSGGRLAATPVAGTLLGPLTLQALRYHDPAAGLDLRIGQARLDWVARALLAGRLQVTDLELQQVSIDRSEPAEPPDDAPFSLEPPIDLRFDRLSLRDLVLRQDGQEQLRISAATARVAWDSAGVHVEQLDLLAPDGELHFAATLDHAAGVFTGRGEGRFDWQAGTQRFAGTLAGRTRGTLGELELQLREPLAAALRLGLQQQPQSRMPWHFSLDVPAFDPRARLLPDSDIGRLAARLEGQGDLDGGTVSGTLRIDDATIALQPLRITRRDDDLAFDASLANGNGQLQAIGELRLARQPIEARLDLDWRDVVLPAALAGQPLHSRGTAHAEGSIERYSARASFAAGPPRRLAEIQLAFSGDRAGLNIQQLDIVQPGGRLGAAAELAFGDTLRWQARAQARDFDPGALLAGWPGRLSFALSSDGRFTDLAHSSASLRIDDLRGRLRGRAVAGRADLQLAPQLRLAGALELRSGASRLRLDGTSGKRVDATLRLDVPDLDDWLPGGRGSLEARVQASGHWPALEIAGRANGRALAFDAAAADTLELTLDVEQPLEPRGGLRLVLGALRAGDTGFSTLELRVQGAAAAHRLELEARGRPVSTMLSLSGTLQGADWRGEIAQLVLDATDLTRLELERPVQAAWNGTTGAFALQTACLADRDMRLCLDGQGQVDGALQAGYQLQHLPLGLLAALAPTALPVNITGQIDGQGRIVRNADGSLQGTAELSAAGGRIRLAEDGESDASSARLLDYRDLRLDAAFTGRNARATLTAGLDQRGHIDASLAAGGLGTALTTLDGRLQASMPSLAVAGAFAPELANVDGRLQLDLGLGGTLDRPELEGSVLAEDLVADVPDLGIALRAGHLRVTPQADGSVQLDGGVRSGDGELSITGTAHREGRGQAQLSGRNFLAADRPGAHVLVTPDLRIKVDDGRLEVTGKLAIPTAQIDLQRLPRGDGTQSASPDVVVIDDPPGDAAGGMLPLFATVDLELGQAVDLTGFGLKARVSGGLRVSESPGQVTTAAGEIRVAGRYQAYGQDLTIRQGQLLYAALPLDDPNLNIVAVRVIGEVTAGLRVTGRARTPQLEVFSTPPMGQANALAWLVTGKPLDAISQGDAEGDTLQSAARSLGTAAGGLLARSVGRRLGVDELGIAEDDALGGAALTIGQYLSPRVFVSYGVGLFKPGEVVKLIYRISDSLSLEAQSATDSSRVGVQYRIER